ncbi:MAG: hypothetical protein MUE50_07320 [Pirellulaceae bacterium]|jgi:hypothetical protein|nr:hypothetical protein [Pirellulaceae bacterium]
MWRRIGYTIVWSLCCAIIGFLIGVATFAEERLASGIFLAVCGAIIGMVFGIRVIRVVGWTMIAGAFCGGLIAILATGIGKMAIYGVPLGTIIGLGVGIGIEQNFRKP